MSDDHPPAPLQQLHPDVVVVGAGLSGLICARALRAAGLAVQVLEARPRCGGRMHRQLTASGLPVDLGGQWVGATHHRLQALLAEFGLRRFPTFYEGEGVFHWNGQAHRAGVEHPFEASLLFFKPQELGLAPAAIDEVQAVQRRFRHLVDQVPALTPWSTPDATVLDRTTVSQWLEQLSSSALAAYPLAWLTRLGGSGGFEPHESSILHLAWTQAVAPQHETPEAWLVEGGIGQVGERLAAELQACIQLGTPVVTIRQQPGGVLVGCADGTEVNAGAAVVAIPPPLRLAIYYDPPLPAQWSGLLQRSPMGAMVKVLALYRQPFWRGQGLNGLGIGNLPTLELTVDSSPPGGPGVLAGFIAGERAARWQELPEREQRQAVVADLVAWWGPQAAEPMELVLHNWNRESWSGGAFTSFLTPGAWTSYGPIWQQPHERVLWAGTEASSRWPGYFEGAIEAGLAAAAQARALLA